MRTKQTVFVIDDDDFFRKILAQVFQSAGFQVATFDSANAFLSQYSPHENACLILDLRMPDISGLELQEKLKQQGIDIPIVFYTGNADVPVAVRAMQAGAFAVIEKPSSNELMIERVKAAIASHTERLSYRKKLSDARSRLQLLSERERQVGRYLSQGLSAPEIALLLKKSPRTVEAHRANIFRKLEIKSTAALTRLFVLSELGDN